MQEISEKLAMRKRYEKEIRSHEKRIAYLNKILSAGERDDMEILIRNRTFSRLKSRKFCRHFLRSVFFDESQLVGSWVMPVYQEA